MKTGEKLIIALDLPTEHENMAIVQTLASYVWGFKVGLRAITAGFANSLIARIVQDCQVFYDAKWFEIPDVAIESAREAGKLGVNVVSVHLSAGSGVVRAVQAGSGPILVAGVTILSSLDDEEGECLHVFNSVVIETVERLADIGFHAGIRALISSPQELNLLVPKYKSLGFKFITPSVRPLGANKDDQRRVMTPAQALAAGADWLVIGRPIINAGKPLDALQRIINEIEESK